GGEAVDHADIFALDPAKPPQSVADRPDPELRLHVAFGELQEHAHSTRRAFLLRTGTDRPGHRWSGGHCGEQRKGVTSFPSTTCHSTTCIHRTTLCKRAKSSGDR